jgi:hypothetical protein
MKTVATCFFILIFSVAAIAQIEEQKAAFFDNVNVSLVVFDLYNIY